MIIESINKYFGESKHQTARRVLVPGVGQGRLLLELVKEGYHTQGNEFSYHMLFSSNFVLNNIESVH